MRIIGDEKAAYNPAQHAHARGRMDKDSPKAADANDSRFAGGCDGMPLDAKVSDTYLTPRVLRRREFLSVRMAVLAGVLTPSFSASPVDI